MRCELLLYGWLWLLRLAVLLCVIINYVAIAVSRNKGAIGCHTIVVVCAAHKYPLEEMKSHWSRGTYIAGSISLWLFHALVRVSYCNLQQ